MKSRLTSPSCQTPARPRWRAVCLAAFVSLLASVTAPAAETVDARILSMMQKNVNDPWPTTGLWHFSCYALAALYLNTDVANANDKIIEFCTSAPVPDDTTSAVPSYFMLHLLWRIYLDPTMNSRLTPEARTQIELTMWRWIRTRSSISDAENSNIWRIYDSENHNAMRKAGFLLCAEALKDVPGYGPDRLLADGKTIQQHAAAWTSYFLRYFPARAREGINVEIACPQYAKYTVGAYYNLMDFADSPALRAVAKKFIHLYWADTASDWTSSGVRGGGETRCFKDAYLRLGSQYSFLASLWAYGWHENTSTGRTYALIPAASSYRIPEIITASATDPARPNFLYTSRRFGRGGEWVNKNYTVVFDSGNSNLRRDTFVTPDYSMGTFTVDMNRDYIALIDQSRAMGVRFASGVNDRIMVFGKGNSTEPTKSFADISGITRENCMVVQRDPNANTSGNATHVFISQAVWNNRVENGGWLFTQTGNAYAAIKPAGGGYTAVSASYGYEMVLGDMWAPVVIQTGQAGNYADFATFQASVMANAFTFVSNTLNYTSEAGDTFTLYANSKTTPRINGTTVDLNPAKTFDSPYLSMIHGENTATVSYAGYPDLVLDFGPPPVLTSLAPANGGTNVPVGAYLVATFNEAIAAGTGEMTLRRAADHSVVEVFDVETSPNLSFSGSQVTINPSTHLEPATAYYVEIAPTAIGSANFFAGLSGPGAWAFTTDASTVTPPYTIIHTGSKVVVDDKSGALETAVSSMSFTAGAWADLLVVALSSEKGSGPYSVSYNGVALTLAIAGTAGSSADIWYLSAPYTGGAADLVVDMIGVPSVNGYGLGVMSVDAEGQEMMLHATAKNLAGSPQSVTLGTTAEHALVVTSFNSNDSGGSVALDAPLTPLYVSANIGSARGAAGYHTDVAAGSHTYGWTVGTSPRSAVAAAFVVRPAPGNQFADWITNPLFGLAPADQGLGNDPDGDGIDNGVENFFGTRPDTFSQGLVAGTQSGNTFTFTHPQNASPASDLTPGYTWSKDLTRFLADGATDGEGTKVDFTTQLDTPSRGITTVTATASDAVPKLFFRVGVTSN